MLPARRFQGPYGNDNSFLLKWLGRIDGSQLRADVCEKYSAGYQKVHDETVDECEKEGEARRRANIWLRKTVSKITGEDYGNT